jgi:hypothetical protein
MTFTILQPEAAEFAIADGVTDSFTTQFVHQEDCLVANLPYQEMSQHTR